MKTIDKLKLTQLSKADLEARQMNALRGGSCACGCYYKDNGGSSTSSNKGSNYDNGYTQTTGYPKACADPSADAANHL